MAIAEVLSIFIGSETMTIRSRVVEEGNRVMQLTRETDFELPIHSLYLGELIEALEKGYPLDEEWKIGLHNPHSYRGVYEDLAFEPTTTSMTTAEMLEVIRPCIGQTFEGFKGGDFRMNQHSNVWLAYYGSSGGTQISPLVLTALRVGRSV